MAWSWEVAERDHEIQNALSAAKVRLVGSYLRLTAESRVLDIACGKGGPALVLAGTYGCRVDGIEVRPAFAEAARARAAAAGLDALIDVRTADASTIELEPEGWDAVLCIGATFVWGTMTEAAPKLCAAVPRGGGVAIGEPFWREWPLPAGVEPHGYVTLNETVARFELAGLATTGIVASSEDDRDAYESLHWRAVEEWLAEQPGHPDAAEIRAQHERHRSDYFAFQRRLLGWAVFAGRRI